MIRVARMVLDNSKFSTNFLNYARDIQVGYH